MALDPTVLKAVADAAAGGDAGQDRRPDIGACFQLALISAAERNDEEAADYLRKIIASMKAMSGSEVVRAPKRRNL